MFLLMDTNAGNFEKKATDARKIYKNTKDQSAKDLFKLFFPETFRETFSAGYMSHSAWAVRATASLLFLELGLLSAGAGVQAGFWLAQLAPILNPIVLPTLVSVSALTVFTAAYSVYASGDQSRVHWTS